MNDPRQVVERQRDALDAHDLDALADCFHEDLHSEDFVHPSQTFRGREQVKRNWELVLRQVPDLKVRLVDTAVNGDTVWAEWRFWGTKRSGEMLDLRGVTVSKVVDGRIVSSRRYLAPIDPGAASVEDAFRKLVE